ncbi:DNA polymerase I, partial [Nocardia otitidiscaviarum]|uniref:hypothetical protein n=1 Tax=Nocardia otitidiscaviarum TaxID=1823 RepID=UPI001E40263F
EDAYTSKDLVTIKRDTPIDLSLNNLTYKGYEQSKVAAIFNDLEFRSLLNRIGVEDNSTPKEMQEIEYSIVDEIKEPMFTGKEALVVEMITDNYHE